MKVNQNFSGLLILFSNCCTEVRQMTEGRIQCLNHELTPDLLRTKPDPDVEQRTNQFEQRAMQVVDTKFAPLLIRLMFDSQSNFIN
jgi:hypothetical protein